MNTMHKDELIKINAERGARSCGVLVDLKAIPVLSLGVCVDSEKLVIIGYHFWSKEEIVEMLTENLKDVKDGAFYIAE